MYHLFSSSCLLASQHDPELCSSSSYAGPGLGLGFPEDLEVALLKMSRFASQSITSG